MNELLDRLKFLQEEIVSLAFLVDEITKSNEKEKEELITKLKEASTKNKELTLKLESMEQSELTETNNSKSVFEIIMETVAEFFNMPVEDISIKTNKRSIVQARQICYWFCVEHKAGSLKDIGKAIANRDHATVLNGKKTVNNLCETNKKFKEDFEEIKKKIEKFIMSIKGFSRKDVIKGC